MRKKFGVLFQDGALFGSMNLYDNIAAPLREHTRKNEAEIRELVYRNAELVGLMDRPGSSQPGEVSGGMEEARLGLARAMATSPRSSSSTSPTRAWTRSGWPTSMSWQLTAQKETGATFFIITHNIQSVMRTADYMGVLYRSNLVKFASKQEMLATPNPIIHQFLEGRPEGPIGMDEMADSDGRDYLEGDTNSLDAAALAQGPLLRPGEAAAVASRPSDQPVPPA